MSVLQSNADALLVAVPMIGALAACYFRLDELLGSPKKQPVRRQQVAGVDRDGHQVCLDPDGTIRDTVRVARNR